MAFTVQLGYSGGLIGSAYDISGVVPAVPLTPVSPTPIPLTLANFGNPTITPTIAKDSLFGLYINADQNWSEIDVDGATLTLTYTPAGAPGAVAAIVCRAFSASPGGQ